MLVQFLTDDINAYSGFSASFHYTPIEPNCANWLNMTAQLLKSPDYPTIDCSWVITAPSTDSTVNIKFETFEVKLQLTNPGGSRWIQFCFESCNPAGLVMRDLRDQNGTKIPVFVRNILVFYQEIEKN